MATKIEAQLAVIIERLDAYHREFLDHKNDKLKHFGTFIGATLGATGPALVVLFKLLGWT